MQSIGIFINKENARTYFLQHQQLSKYYLRKSFRLQDGDDLGQKKKEKRRRRLERNHFFVE